MQMKLLLSILFLPIATVLAGGYAGALERVWLFYAYQIDGLNDESSRTMGWKCTSWDDKKLECRTKKGKVQWVKCVGTLPDRRCTFSQFLNHVGGCTNKDQLVADKDGNLLDLKDTNPDPEQTAKNVYEHLVKTKGRVGDYQTYRVLKTGTGDYVAGINDIGAVVEKALADGKKTSENEFMFKRFSECTSLIKDARVGDHGKYLIEGAEEKLKAYDITVKTEKVGSGHNPIDSSDKWETVDWEETMLDAVKGGKSMSDVEEIVNEVKKKFYEDTTAEEHRVVIESYSNIEAKMSGC